jgi:hypothetical protein
MVNAFCDFIGLYHIFLAFSIFSENKKLSQMNFSSGTALIFWFIY